MGPADNPPHVLSPPLATRHSLFPTPHPRLTQTLLPPHEADRLGASQEIFDGAPARSRVLVRVRLDLFLPRGDAGRSAGRGGWRRGALAAVPAWPDLFG